MKKDKEWLKKEIEKIWHSGHPRLGEVVEYEALKRLIEQLDEPEITDPTISKKETVEIPQFVADWIERSKQKRDKLIGVMLYFYVLGIDSDDINVYINENYETFVRAWLDGYAIEKEPEWTVKLDNGRYVDNFIESITGVEVDLSHRLGCTAPIIFKDKSKAEAVALLVGGKVVEVTDNV